MSAFDRFHPLIQRWFREQVGEPTDIQQTGWSIIKQGKHLVITAPTGSGKTLAAFLMAINQFVEGTCHTGAMRVLYVSPLKALNNDIERSLNKPIQELRSCFAEADEIFPDIRVMTRSGDTPQADRQRMLRRPPEIFITTPESLMLVLTTVRGRQALSTVELVVLDEVHAIVENRRGAQLMTCIERLVDLAGEVQRVALSATVRPLGVVAEYVGGFDIQGEPRKVEIIESNVSKRYDFRVRLPAGTTQAQANGTRFWTLICEDLRNRIKPNRSTLFFTNSRHLAEKITLGINAESDTLLAYAHHGSLARDIRVEVENQLKNGDLQAIVATSSLEMGIDIGDLDEVVLVQSPHSIASSLQRVGRAGHRVGEISRSTLFPICARDLIESAVISKAIQEHDIEPLRPLNNALDLLSQIVISMVATETWHVDDVYRTLIRSKPYSELHRNHFDLTIEMLAGRFENVRIHNLKPRIAFDRNQGTIRSRKNAVFAFYSSGGTIPNRGYFRLRHEGSHALIGELDEEFVWEAKIGQTFTFGTQQWKISRITHNDVEVGPAPLGITTPPFWRNEVIDTSRHFGERVGEFLRFANDLLANGTIDDLRQELIQRGFDRIAADELLDYLQCQREKTNTNLPSSDHVVFEVVSTGPGGYRTGEYDKQLIIHTTWGGKVNRPIALALESAWQERYRSEPDIVTDNYTIAMQLRQQVSPESIQAMFSSERFEERVCRSLEGSGFFGARFRECAGRSLLLTRQRFNMRMPLWVTRMQAKQLMAATQKQRDFPVTLETWRTCLTDEFDLPAAKDILQRIEDGKIQISITRTSTPSPFAGDIAFNQINRYMYVDDATQIREDSSIAEDWISEVIECADQRPIIQQRTISEFEEKVQRRASGYIPVDEWELIEWVKERIWIPISEWFSDQSPPDALVVLEINGRKWIVHSEIIHDSQLSTLAKVTTALQFYGPRHADQLADLFPVSAEEMDGILTVLIDEGIVIDGIAVEESNRKCLCNTRNFEILLRLQRRLQRPALEPRPLTDLPQFLALRHQVISPGNLDQLPNIIELFRGYSAPVTFWSKNIWASRFYPFSLSAIDPILAQYSVFWRGTGVGQVALEFEGEPFNEIDSKMEQKPVLHAFKDSTARYTFLQLQDHSGIDITAFNKLFWKTVWGGSITSDSLSFLQLADERNYKLKPPSKGSRRIGSRRATRLHTISWPGIWRRVQPDNQGCNAVSRLENQKDKCRCLLDRYGVLTRELANREGGVFRWASIFPALRVMELSGEIISGLFFDGLSGPQFTEPDTVNAVSSIKKKNTSFWISAWDPVSPCRLGVEWPGLPARRIGNFLGFVDGHLAIVCENNGRKLTFTLDPDDSNLDRLTGSFHSAVSNKQRVAVDTINNVPARSSPYVATLMRNLNVHSDHVRVYVDAILDI